MRINDVSCQVWAHSTCENEVGKMRVADMPAHDDFGAMLGRRRRLCRSSCTLGDTLQSDSAMPRTAFTGPRPAARISNAGEITKLTAQPAIDGGFTEGKSESQKK